MPKSVIDVLLDPKDDSDVTLYVDSKKVKFAQVANVEFEGELYTILIPLEELEGCGEGEGVLFQFVQYDGKIEIELVRDDNLIDLVYQEYLNMVGE